MKPTPALILALLASAATATAAEKPNVIGKGLHKMGHEMTPAMANDPCYGPSADFSPCRHRNK